MKRSGKMLAGAALAIVLACAGGAAFVYSGVYDVSAIDQHTKPVYWLIEFTMRRAIAVRAKESDTPDLTRPDKIERGLALYHENCEQCHGAPGVSPQRAALGMMPVPAYLVRTAREWTPARIHWIVKNGMKMTGMPAWQYRMDDEALWSVVAFVTQRLPHLTARQYADAVDRLPRSAAVERPAAPSAPSPGNADAGRRAIEQYACATCHVIPGITGATKQIGPPLTGIASRTYIAGALPNTSENMTRWLMSPPQVKPGTAMPDLGLRERDARDVAAFLETLRAD
jgi:mono/diheme cytochrome c family protein